MTTNTEVREHIRTHPDATAPSIAGKFGLSRDEAERLLAEHQQVGWKTVDFSDVAFDEWPSEMLDLRQWMAHKPGEKQPYSPWIPHDAPAPCDKHSTPTTCEKCEHSARYKWGWTGNYVEAEKVAMAEKDPRIGGRVFLQQPKDPFAYVDGDDVRCPDTGTVHPKFIQALDKLGLTYGDVSVSGAGVHAIYRGALPEGVKEAAWQLDDSPWGENEDLPSIEIYAGKRVCVMTGNRLSDTPHDVREWDDEALEMLLSQYDQLPEPNVNREREDFDPDEYDPRKEDSDEWTTDIRDIFAALDRIDAQRVAERTIVAEWNDSASTSAGYRAFYPTWGRSSSGTANIVNDEIWQDTGDRGGYGGPVVMALIGEGEVSETTTPDEVQGRLWFKGVEILRDMGHPIPNLRKSKGKPTREELGLDDDTEDEDEKIDQFLAELKLTE